MELNNVNNSGFYNFNLQDKIVKKQNNLPTEKVAVVDQAEKIKPLNSISDTIKENLNTISLIQQTQKTLDKQMDLTKQLDTITVSTENIDTKSSEVSEIIDQYNSSAQRVYNNLHELMEEQKSDKSHMYFDGVLGSIPMSSEEISNASAEQKEVIKEINNKLEETLTKQSDYSKKMIEDQKNDKNFSFRESDLKEPELKDISLTSAHTNSLPSHSFSITA